MKKLTWKYIIYLRLTMNALFTFVVANTTLSVVSIVYTWSESRELVLISGVVPWCHACHWLIRLSCWFSYTDIRIKITDKRMVRPGVTWWLRSRTNEDDVRHQRRLPVDPVPILLLAGFVRMRKDGCQWQFYVAAEARIGNGRRHHYRRIDDGPRASGRHHLWPHHDSGVCNHN